MKYFRINNTDTCVIQHESSASKKKHVPFQSSVWILKIPAMFYIQVLIINTDEFALNHSLSVEVE